MGKLTLVFLFESSYAIRSAAIAILLLVTLGPASREARRGGLGPPTQIAEWNGVRVAVPRLGGSTGGGIEAQPPLPGALRAYLPLLHNELAAYPPEALERCGLREVVVCGHLASNGKSVSGIPDSEVGRLYLEAPQDERCGPYARMTVHHEIFHLIDLKDDGQLYSDEGWEGLNIAGFRYGSGGWSMLGDPTASLPDETVAGFLNAYSRSGVEEDKAEVFSHMMAEPEVLRDRMTRDPILAAKHRAMTMLIKRFCPEMGEGFGRAP